MKRRWMGVATAAVVLGTVFITATELRIAAAADPVPTTVTLPLFGAPLTIDVTTASNGTLTEVTVDPADGTVATKLKSHMVVFESANAADPAAGPARVVVKSNKGQQKISTRAGSLAELSGPGTWSGDVFGDGSTSTVAFTVGAAAGGGPDISSITTTGATAVVGTVEHGDDGDDDADVDAGADDHEQSAKVSIVFTNASGDQSRTLTIKVNVDNDDGKAAAKLTLARKRVKGAAVDATDAAGPHTWTGTLCDGSPATISYTVDASGSISGATATPETADVRTGHKKIDVRFSQHERVRIHVRASNGLIRITVQDKNRCKSLDVTTNVSTAAKSGRDDDDDKHDRDHAGGDEHGPADRAEPDDDVTTSTGG